MSGRTGEGWINTCLLSSSLWHEIWLCLFLNVNSTLCLGSPQRCSIWALDEGNFIFLVYKDSAFSPLLGWRRIAWEVLLNLSEGPERGDGLPKRKNAFEGTVSPFFLLPKFPCLSHLHTHTVPWNSQQRIGLLKKKGHAMVGPWIPSSFTTEGPMNDY